MVSVELPASGIVRWAWAMILAAALATRLLGLPANPLAPDEVTSALAALDAERGLEWVGATDSPLLLVGNAGLFTLFGAGEGIARLLPALAGVVIVMLPWMWRRQVGDLGALTAAGLLLVSPLSLFSARRVDATSLAILAAGLGVTSLFITLGKANLAPSESGLLLTTAIALGLVAGPAFYDLLLPGGIACWILWRRMPTRREFDLRWHRPVLIGLGIALLLSTAFGLRWTGWAGVLDGAAAWLTGWMVPGSRSSSLTLLLLYEPLLVTLSVVAIGLLATRSNSRTPVRLAVCAWALLAGGLVAARPGSTPETLSAVVLPLALLSGSGLQELLCGVTVTAKRRIGLHALAAFIFWIPGMLGLAYYARGAVGSPSLAVAAVVVLMALQLLLVLIFMLYLPVNQLWLGTLFGITAALLLLQGSFASGLAFTRSTSPLEPAVGPATAEDLRHLHQLLREIAILKNTRQDALEVTFVGQDAELAALIRWNLRDFRQLRVSAAWPAEGAPPVITPESTATMEPTLPEQWRGIRFVALTSHASPVPRCEPRLPPVCPEFALWLLYRKTPSLPQSTGVILWQTEDQLSW